MTIAVLFHLRAAIEELGFAEDHLLLARRAFDTSGFDYKSIDNLFESVGDDKERLTHILEGLERETLNNIIQKAEGQSNIDKNA